MIAPKPEPISLQLVKHAELHIGIHDPGGSPPRVGLGFSRPDCDGAPLFEVYLDLEQAIDVVDRLVGAMARLKGYAKDGAGPISSTY